jgi:hypothetical protein
MKKKNIKKKKRYTVYVEGHVYCPHDEATYRVFATSPEEAKEKAREKFEMDTGSDWDVIETKIKTKGEKKC